MIGIGLAIICGYLVGKLMSRFNIPSVAGYIITGLILGESVFNVFDQQEVLENVASVSDLALALIAFSIGGELLLKNFKKMGSKRILNTNGVISYHYNY